MKNELKATTVRALLSLLLVISILGGAAGFYFGLEQVRVIAINVTHASEDASAGKNQVEELQALKIRLEETKVLVEKADTMFTPVADYQGKALFDLRAYATAAGVSIVNTDFSEKEGTGVSTANTRPVTITLAQPVSYASLLRFLELTEDGLPKITASGIKITRPATTSGDNVAVEPITLRISVK